MTATTLYVEACKRLLFLESQNMENPGSWDEHLSLLPKLRQALSCRVCRGLLVDPHGSQSCQHFVCRGCLRKKRSLNPGCRWCLNLDNLREDKQIRIVMACYKKLCEVLMSSLAIKRLQAQNGEVNRTQAILLEAISTPISLEEQNKPNLEAHAVPIAASLSGENLNPVETKVLKKAPDVGVIAKRQVLQILKETGDEENGSAKGQRKRRKHFRGSSYFSPKRRRGSNRSKSEEFDMDEFVKNDVMGNDEVGKNAIKSETKATNDDVFCNVNNEMGNDDEDEERFHDCLTDSTPDHKETNCKLNDKLEIKKECCIKTGEADQEEIIVDVVEPVNGIHEHLTCSLKTELINFDKTYNSTSEKLKLSNKPNHKSCFCGRRAISLKSGNKRCANVRCSCFLGGYSCEDCPCKYCSNPYNDNNNLSDSLPLCGSAEVEFVNDEEILLVS